MNDIEEYLDSNSEEEVPRLNSARNQITEQILISQPPYQDITTSQQLELSKETQEHVLVKVQESDQDVITYRCLKTACHELCHVFGLTHCPYYDCLMNGSNLLEEADRKPFLLCPVCLRKVAVYHNFVNEIAKRYIDINLSIGQM